MRAAAVALLVLPACKDEGSSPCGPLDLDNPDSIDETFDRIDLLPEPTIPCLVQSLQRPLSIETSSGSFSAQPAVGERSPRVFVRSERLSLSISLDGSGLPLLELGELTEDGRTVKAEIAFPVEAPLDRSAPFDRIAAESGTVCGLCHIEEGAVAEGRFASRPLRPTDDDYVPLSRLSEEREICDPAVEPDRCALLAALVDHGELVRAPFPEGYPTIFGP